MVPEEEEEIEGEIEKQPLELEEMLELFRDDEEPPRKGFNPMWLVLAIIVVVGGCWLATVGVGAFVEKMNGLRSGGPRGAKAAERGPETVVDVAADYRERCRKGMTKSELRWVIGDFRRTRLDKRPGALSREIQQIFDSSGGFKVWAARDGDDDPLPISQARTAELKSKILQLLKAQQDWYVDALADGLRLSPQQIAKAKERARLSVAEMEAEVLKHCYPVRSKAPDSDLVLYDLCGELPEGFRYIFPESKLSVPGIWLEEKENAPWERCDLGPQQLELTNFNYWSAQHGENATEPWLMAPETKDGSGKEIVFPDLLRVPACVLPFTADQVFPVDGDGLPLNEAQISVLSKLHPAQFKLLLLSNPDLADEVEGLLNYE